MKALHFFQDSCIPVCERVEILVAYYDDFVVHVANGRQNVVPPIECDLCGWPSVVVVLCNIGKKENEAAYAATSRKR